MIKWKKLLAMLVCMAMVLSFVPAASFASTGDAETMALPSANDPSVFKKQSGKGRCTLASVTMMLRRNALLSGNENWDSITESAVEPYGWVSGAGQRLSFSYAGMTVKYGMFSGSSADKKNKLISLLSEHAEGVVIYMYPNDSYPSKRRHAVLATDYDASSDTVYCADPASGIPSGRIKLTQAYLSGDTQDQRIGNLNQYWYISSGSCNLTSPAQKPAAHTHSWITQLESGHPHQEYKTCTSCGAKEYTGSTRSVTSCRSCYPIGNIVLTRTVDKTGGSATFKRGNASNATDYTLQLYQNGGLYATYSMNAIEHRVNGLSAGSYSASLIVRNTNTGQEKTVSCDDFRIYNTYTVQYDANGGTGAPAQQSKIQDQPLTLSRTVPTKKGYNFLGWASSRTAAYASYEAGGRYNRNTNITLYAVWEPKVFDIHFDLNGGKGELQDQKLTYGDTMRMPNSAIKDGCYLRGWAKSYDASAPEYRLGMDYTFEDDATLYAVWGDSSWSGGTATAFAGGSGTKDDPYQISSAAELAYLAQRVNSQTSDPEYEYYELTGNISLGNTEWVPIGLYGNDYQYFRGSFDGNGYTISDLRITKAYEGYVGIFGYAKGKKSYWESGKFGELKNVAVSGDIHGFTMDNRYGDGYVGALLGRGLCLNIDSCKATYVNVSGVSFADEGCLGCLLGDITGDIINCSAYTCFISLDRDVNWGNLTVGQLSGCIDGNLTDCEVTSQDSLMTISGTVGQYTSVGGMVGASEGMIYNCTVSAAQLTSNPTELYYNDTSYSTFNIGGLVGICTDSILRCTVKFTSDDDSICVNSNRAKDMYVGGIAGNMSRIIEDSQYQGGAIVCNGNKNEKANIKIGGLTGKGDCKKCFAKVNGVISANCKANIGGASGSGVVNDVVVIVNEIISNNTGSKVGDIVGEINLSATYQNNHVNDGLKLTTSGKKVETSETKRPMSQLKSASFQQRVFGTPYQSMDYLQENPDAVWVIREGQLPTLYTDCLNEISVGAVEHGTVTVDKSQAVDGEIVTVSAVPDQGYVLGKIYVNGVETVGSTFEVSGDSSVYATFGEITPEYRATVQATANAAGSLENVDADPAEIASAVFLMADGSSGIKALDGAEIRVNAEAAAEYTVDAIYVNGEELGGNSFIIDKDTVITLDVAGTSTKVTAVTNDAEDVDSWYATLSGSVSGQGDGIVRYIRYWMASEPENVILTEVEAGGGDYSVRIDGLLSETTYMFQMTEFGDIKSFTTGQEPDVGLDDGDVGDKPGEKLTATTYKKLSSSYRFYVDASEPLENAFVIVTAYDGNGKLLSVRSQECDGSASYTIDIPLSADIKRAKVFVWRSLRAMTPLGEAETVEIV